MEINFERLVSRNIAITLSRLLELSGMNLSINKLLEYIIVGFFSIFIIGTIILNLFITISIPFSIFCSFVGGILYIVIIYGLISYKTDKRKSAMETLLPDYFQLVSANLRGGIAMDRSMLLAARPEFAPFSIDIQQMNNRLFSGESFDVALHKLSRMYNSHSLDRSIKLIIQAEHFGGQMSDLIEQISRDMRNQQIVQKEIASQLFMYSIFIAFAGLIAAPVLYGLTSQMIRITSTVWKGILSSNPGGLPTTGTSFLKPHPPLITVQEYHTFSLIAIAIITGFAAIIMSAITSGKSIRGIRYLPIFVIVGITIFIVISALVGGLFGSIGGGGGV